MPLGSDARNASPRPPRRRRRPGRPRRRRDSARPALRRDYRVESLGDPERAVRTLEELARAGEAVALVLVGKSLSDATGGELLERARQLHPHAKRGLVVPPGAWADQPTAEAILDAMALGRIDYYVPRPAASPDEVFHQAISSFLLEWATERRMVPHTVHIVGEAVVGQGLRAEGGLRALRGPARLLPGRLGRGARAARQGGSRGEASADGPPRRAGPERPLQRRDRGGRRRPDRLRGARLRRRHRRRRAGGPVRGGLRRLRGAAHPRRGRGRHRRAGQVELADPQLPRLPAEGVSGSRLAEQAYEQASVFGASFVFMHRATALGRSGDQLSVSLVGRPARQRRVR